MRVLMAHWRLGWSGAPILMSQISQHLRACGCQVDCVLTVDQSPYDESFRPSFDELWACLDRGFEAAGAYLERFRSEILRRRYDLVMVHHSLQAVAVAGLLPQSLSTVSVIHENPKLGAGYVALSNLDAFDAYVAVSHGVGIAAEEILGKDRYLTVIPNGVSVVDAPKRIERETLEALYVGRLEEESKGVLLLPEIMANVRILGLPVHLSVVGGGPARALLEEAIARLGVEHSVSLLGALPHASGLEVMVKADVLLHTSRHEGLSLVVLEAMMRGCIPVATHLSESTAEAICSGVDGVLIKDRNPRSFALALQTLTESPELRAKMSAAAGDTARTRFSIDRVFLEYSELLESLSRRRHLKRRVQNCPRFELS